MTKLLRYEMKSNLLPAAVFSAIACLIVGIVYMSSDLFFLSTAPGGNGGLAYIPYDSLISAPTAVLAVLCVAVPVMQFSYRMKVRDIDLWYSLPVTREKLTLARTLGGLMLIFVPYTLSYWLGFVILLVRENCFVLYGYPLYYLVSLPLGALLFGIYSFLYTRANSVGDGLVCMAGWTFALMLPFAFLSVHFPRLDLPRSFSVWQLTPFGLLSRSAEYFNELICAETMSAALPLAWMIPLTVLEGAGAYAGLFLTARRHKAENGGQLSSSLWCYRVLVPLYAFILASSLSVDYLGTQLAFIEGAFLLVGGLICFVVYRRSFRLKTSDILTLAVSFGAGVLVAVLFGIV